MAYKVEISARAERDLVRIFGFIEAETSDPARRWFRELYVAIRSLSEMPERCPRTSESESHRHLLYENSPDVYRIIFRIDSRRGRVLVKHIHHGARSHFRG
jgi:plasmid stabilization system protein ParE